MTATVGNRRASLWGWYLALALGKLWLVAGDEVVVRDYPFDDPWYVFAARSWYWFADYVPWGSFGRAPAYPLWLAATDLLGLPARIAIELLLLVAAWSWARALGRVLRRPWLGAGAFAAVVFHPLGLTVPRYILPDAFYAAVLLLAFAALAGTWLAESRRGNLRAAAGAGLALAILWHARQESILIVLLLACHGTLVLRLARNGEPGLRRADALRGLALVVAILAAASIGIRSLNYWRYGVFANTEDDLPGLVAARKALLRIPPEQPRRFVPVSRDVRQQAYAVSPTFRELEPLIEGDLGATWSGFGRQWLGVTDDIATAWLSYLLLSAAVRSGHHDTAREGNDFYARIAEEINGACAGRLSCRRVLHDRLDPAYTTYLGFVPGTLARALRHFVLPVSLLPDEEVEGDVSPATREAFDQVTNRRTAAAGPHVSVSGWAVGLPDPVTRVALIDREGRIATSARMVARPDVAAALAVEGVTAPAESGFTLFATGARAGELSVAFALQSGDSVALPAGSLRIHAGRVGAAGIGEPAVRYAIESVQSGANHVPTARRAQLVLAGGYGRMLAAATLVALLGIPAIARHRGGQVPARLVAVLSLVGIAVVTRVILLVLIDVSSFPALQERYLFSAVVLYSSTAVAVALAAVARVVRLRPGGGD